MVDLKRVPKYLERTLDHSNESYRRGSEGGRGVWKVKKVVAETTNQSLCTHGGIFVGIQK